MYAIQAEQLARTFKPDIHAVAGIDLAIEPGKVFGFLGQNGSGKTTTVRMLTTLLRPTGGWARVAGFDVTSNGGAVRQRIGVALQEAGLDEVQTGMGRTGRMFASEHDEISPDIMCLAKALGGGVMPIGAFMSTPEVWQVLVPNPTIHNSTFGGNPLACAAASATIDVLIEENLPARSAVMGSYFKAQLDELKKDYPDMIGDVRGLGLLLGLEFTSEELRWKVQTELFYRGVLVAATLNAHKTMRLEPPLIINKPQIDLAVRTIKGILDDIIEGKLSITE